MDEDARLRRQVTLMWNLCVMKQSMTGLYPVNWKDPILQAALEAVGGSDLIMTNQQT
jgi:hypothetical protein